MKQHIKIARITEETYFSGPEPGAVRTVRFIIVDVPAEGRTFGDVEVTGGRVEVGRELGQPFPALNDRGAAYVVWVGFNLTASGSRDKRQKAADTVRSHEMTTTFTRPLLDAVNEAFEEVARS